VAATLRDRGLDVRAIRPPSVPHGTARIRLTVTANHGPGDIENALGHLAAARNESADP
jgi:8-amino-7-oxononanoate synthase